jgi:AAA+ superfamily predicted ATPase
MAVAHNALAAILSPEVHMLGEKISDLGLYGLSQQGARPLPEDFGELIVKGSWLNQLGYVIVGHGISLLRWRSGGVKHLHDMPPFRFAPSPTFGDNSLEVLLYNSGLGYGYLKPILFIVGVIWVMFGAGTSLVCRGGLEALRDFLVEGRDVSSNVLTDIVNDVCRAVNGINFRLIGQPEGAVAAFGEILSGQATALPLSVEEDPTSVAVVLPTDINEENKFKVLGTDDEVSGILSELTEMIGLQAVKNEIVGLAKFIKVSRMRKVRGFKQAPISLHLIFTGNPGTGKTTVARLVAKLYKALGLLSKGHLVEVDRGGLVSQYVGGTAIKTKEVVESALEGVLFVDEAYSLYKETTWGDVGSEAVDTLLKLMEDHRGRLAVIVAGYTDKMTDFIASNPGLQSRFTRQIEFDDYTADEMLRIFERNAGDNSFELDPDARQTLLDHFQKIEGDSGFGNGRGVRNTFEAAIVAHANRIGGCPEASDDDLKLIVQEDVDVAFEHCEGRSRGSQGEA